MHLKCGTVQLQGKSLFLSPRLLAARAVLTCNRAGWARLQDARGRRWLSCPIDQSTGIAVYLGQALLPTAAEHMVRCGPRALDHKAETETHPGGGAGFLVRTRGMLSVEGRTQLQGTGNCSNTGAARRRLYVMFTSSKCISRQKHLL